ncbi:MAG TPA: serine/threonine-protein kinase, partial [Gemmatimonadaceae bacterium]|nr:serine/threonine-protein kinase [Gemmatimonadaceae bacterium]
MSADLSSQLGNTLGTAYTIERELRAGGMARVFVAVETALARRVVIKVLSPDLAAGVSAQRFAREIRLAASLQQANIVPVLSTGETEGLPYYTMPFVEGLSLRDRMQEGRLPVTTSISILRDVARALAFAHEHGVVHRDIKPENILLSGDSAVVTDFGIARALTRAMSDQGAVSPEPTITQFGSALGTPAYMAPEQVAADPNVDHRADIYAFGCLAYELVAGESPFAGRSTQQLLAAHLGERPIPLSEKAPDCAPGITTLVMRCLEKDAGARPQSARELLMSLEMP